MTRDETIALFLECEAKRPRGARGGAAEGKGDDAQAKSRTRPRRRIGTPGPRPC